MARQSIPRFDLYAELGVEPSADDGAIEAAYHAQIDHHLPNVDASATRRRVARLNQARDWLSDSELRSRYDASQARAAARSTAGAPAGRRSPGPKAGTRPRKPAPRRAKAPAAGTGAAAAAETDAAAAAETEAAATGTVGAAAAAAAATGLTASEAAEAEARAAAEAQAAAAAPPITPAPAPADFSWPAADFVRAATRVDPPPPRRSSRRVLRGVAGLAALVAVLALIVLALTMRPTTPVAVASPTAPAATPTAIPETPTPQPEPTVAVTPLPTEFVVPPAALQQAAWSTIQALAAAAAAGDVATAQTMLGDTAPGLRASGLKRAVFPTIDQGDISTQREGEVYVALAGDDRLTSPDGVTWTFDYADRPLRAYAWPAGIPARDLFWIERDGKHHLYLRVAVATVSKSGVTVEFTWHYAADRPDDATYFRRATLLISSVALDDTPITVTAASMPMRGVTTLTATATFTGVPTVPDLLTIGVTVSNPRTAGGAARAIDVVFKLEGR